MAVFRALLLLLAVGVVYSKARTGLRWDVTESDGRLVRSLTDGQEILTLEYNEREELVQCWQNKDVNPDSISLMFYAAMSHVSSTRKDAIDIDMKKIKKDCKNYMRQIESAENKTALQEQMESIRTLRDGIDGSKWCGLQGGKVEKKALKREDRCCKKWHNCDVQIKGYHYDYMMYNYRPHKLVACNCTLELESCLSNITTSGLADEILHVMFGETGNSYTPVCVHTEKKKERCVQWDKFYHKCEKYEWADYGTVRSLREYREIAHTTHNLDENIDSSDDGATQTETLKTEL